MKSKMHANDGKTCVKVVFLDFNGARTCYCGDLVAIENVVIENPGLSQGRIMSITSSLNQYFTGQNIHFTAKRPETASYSTVFVGKSSSFAPFGSFAGLAESLDRSDANAFVFLDSASENSQIALVIAHEVRHLAGLLEHGGEGLRKYAYNSRYDITSGVTSTGLTLNHDSMYVSNGGVANSTTINSAGSAEILSGGVASAVMVNADGNLTISNGGTASDTAMHAGVMTVLMGGTAYGINWTPCEGVIRAEDGTTLTFASAYSGVYYGSGNTLLSSGASMSEKTIAGSNSNTMYVFSGGTATNINVLSGGFMFVTSDGTATNINWTPCEGVIRTGDGANLTFISAYSGVYYGSNNQLLSTGASMTGKTVNGSGTMYVFGGGTVTNTRINSGGYVFVASTGKLSGTLLNAGGSLSVANGGVASDTIIRSAFLSVSSGGVASNTTLTGGWMSVLNGGSVNLANVNSDGIFVLSGGTAGNLTVNSCGVFRLSGGVANTVSVTSSGTMTVYGGTANDVVVDSYGSMVLSGGTVSDIKLQQWGNLVVSSGGVASGIIISSGSSRPITIASGASLTIASGGSVHLVTVLTGGVLTVLSGGTADSVIESGGFVESASGAVVSCLTNTITSLTVDNYDSASVHSGTTAVKAIVNNGSLCVFSRGIAYGTEIHSRGYMNVKDGGISFETVVNHSGVLEVAAGGSADIVYNPWSGTVSSAAGAVVTYQDRDAEVYIGDQNDGLISRFTEQTEKQISLVSGQSMIVYGSGVSGVTLSNGSMFLSGGTANNVVINSSGCVVVSSGSICGAVGSGMNGCAEVHSGGKLYLSSGAVANNVVLNIGGSLYVSSGATASIEYNPWQGAVTSKRGAEVTYLDPDKLIYYGNYYSGLVFKTDEEIIGSREEFKSGAVTGSGTIHIRSGGVVSAIRVGRTVGDRSYKNPYGSMIVSYGGVVHAPNLGSYGSLCVMSGGSVTDMVFNGGTLNISSGGTAYLIFNPWSPDVEETPGAVIVSESSPDFRVYYGNDQDGLLSKTDYISGVTLSSGAAIYLYDVGGKGIAENINAESSGYVYVSGGSVSKSHVSSAGRIYVSSAGMVDSVTLSSGASMIVYASGSARYTHLESDGALDVVGSKGVRGVAESTTANGGRIVAGLLGFVSETALENGGTMTISSGGSARGGHVIGGTTSGSRVTSNLSSFLIVSEGGVATDMKIGYLGYAIASSGGLLMDISAETGYGNNITVSSGGKVSRATLHSGGSMEILSGGNAVDVSCAKLEGDSSFRNDLNVISCAAGGSLDTAYIGESGLLYVLAGASTTSTTIDYRGNMIVTTGGVAKDVIEKGGFVSLASGVTAVFQPNTFRDSHLFNGDSATVHSGTTAANLVLNSGGAVYLYQGGKIEFAYDPWRGSGNSAGVVVESGITADISYLETPDELVYYGGKATGLLSKTSALNGVTVSAASGDAQVLYVYSSGGTQGLVTDTHVSGYSYHYTTYDSETKRYTTHWVASGASVFVGTSVSITRDGSKFIEVLSGGKAEHTTLDFAGSMYVQFGGIASDTILTSTPQAGSDAYYKSSGGRLYVQSSGITENTTVNAGGSMFVSEGGTANSTTVNSSGNMFISNGGTASSTMIDAGGSMHVSEGGTANSTTVNCDGNMCIFSGGTANAVFLERGANLSVGYYGSASSVQVSAGGNMTVSGTNAKAENVTVFAENVKVVSGGTVSSATISSGGILKVQSYGKALEASVSSGGRLNVSGTSAKAEKTTVSRGGVLEVQSYGCAVSATVLSGGLMVCSGSGYYYGIASADSAMISSGGTLRIGSAGSAKDAWIQGGGTATVSNGGMMSNVLVNLNANLYVSAWGTAYVAFNPWNGSVKADAGARVSSLDRDKSIYYGDSSVSGLIWKEDSKSDFEITSGCSMLVYSSGSAENISISGGGLLILSEDGAVVNGLTAGYKGTAYISGGTLTCGSNATNLIEISDGAVVSAFSGCTINFDIGSSTTSKGTLFTGWSYLEDKGANYTITVSTQQTYTTYSLIGNAENFTHNMTIQGAGTSKTLSVDGKDFFVDNGNKYTLNKEEGVVTLKVEEFHNEVKVYSSGSLLPGVAGQSSEMSGVTLVSGGSADLMTVAAGGSAFDTTVSSGGKMEVSGGISGSESAVAGIASGVDIYAGGLLKVSSCGSVSSVTVSYGGVMTVIGANAAVNGAEISSGGSMIISGGTVTDAKLYADVSVCGLIDTTGEESFGLINSAVVNACELEILSGGKGNSLKIASGGLLMVRDGGSAEDVTVSSGCELRLRDDGNLLGSQTFEEGAKVVIVNSGTIDFTVKDQKEKNTALIKNLSAVTIVDGGKLNYTLTVKSEQDYGVYILADGAADFNQTITVYKENVGIGTLEVGETLADPDGTRSYTLVKADNTLSLSVNGKVLETYAGAFYGIGGAFQLLEGGYGMIRSAAGRTFVSGKVDLEKWSVCGVGDFNGSGKDGLLWLENSTGNVYMQYDMTSFDEVNNRTNLLGILGEGYSLKGTGDFSGSGIAGALLQGLAYGDPEVSVNYGLHVWAREADGTTFPGWLGALVNTWQEGDRLKGNLSDLASINASNYQYAVVGVGDFNGDGRDDVMIQNTMPGVVTQDDVDYKITGSGDVFTFLTGDTEAIKRGDDPTVAYTGNVDSNWDVIGFGDFDGDGTDDALLCDSNGIGLAGWKMANGQRTGNFWFGNLDNGNEVVGIADYNNDGTDDILIRTAGTEKLNAWLIKNGEVTGWVALK